MVTTRMPWAIWSPVAGFAGGGQFSGTTPTNRKIVLFTVTTTNRPPQYGSGPPHFSFDLSPSGKVWQHVPLDRPAYLLKGGVEDSSYRNPNADAGKLIQIEIITPRDSVDVLRNWTDSRYERLGYYCAQIMKAIGGEVVVGADFDLTRYGKSLPNRVKWKTFKEYKGIVGGMHTPFNDNNKDPGWVDIIDMLRYLRDGENLTKTDPKIQAPPPSATVPGTGVITTPATTPTTGVTGTTTPQPNLHGLPLVIGNETYVIGKEYVTELQSTFGSISAPLVVVDGTMAGKNFRFNPPLHPLNLPVRVDFSSENPNRTMSGQYLDERLFSEPYSNPDNLRQLRLGRIIQHENAAGMAAVNKERYGFRFLYNPTSVSIATVRNDSVILDSRSAVSAVISGVDSNFQVIDMRLLLNRMPDVMMHEEYVRPSDYMPGITEDDRQGLRKYGTHWDLEILYRLCNGIWNLADRGTTGDIGALLPSNARLLLGPEQNHFGFVESISWQDLMFSGDMVPVRTEVSIRFRRHVDMAPGRLFQVEGAYMADDAGQYEEWVRPLNKTAAQDDATFASLGFGPLGLGINFATALHDYWSNRASGGTAPQTPTAPTGPTTTPPGVTTPAPAPGGGASAPNNKDAPVPGYNLVTGGWHYNSGSLHGAWDYGKGGIAGKPVHCTKDGTIVRLKRLTESYGIHVVVKSGTVYHYYCHLRDFAPGLAVGKSVVAGTHLGYVGSTGNSTGPHLHYEERENDRQYSRHPQWGVASAGSKS